MSIEAWPGPMEGVFSPAFLAAAAELRLSNRWMTSFFRISDNCPRLKFFRAFLECYPRGAALCGQLMGETPELLAEAARRMVEAGAGTVNLNFGCPAPRVVSSGAGGALLRKPELAAAIVAAVAAAVPEVEVSVKMRAGFASPEESETLIPAFTAAGARKIFFHFRTVREIYLPAAPGTRERRFRRAVELADRIPVVLNGDLDSVEEALRVCASCGGAGVMAARKWMRDPFWPRRVEGESALPPPEEARRRFLEAAKKHGVSGGALIGLTRRILPEAPLPIEV